MVTKDLSGRPELNDVLELADLLRPAWADISAGIPPWHPRNEGDDDAGDTGTADAAAAGAAAGAAGAARRSPAALTPTKSG